MRHFNYFENGGPFPGTCLSCGNNKDLYDIGGTRIDGGTNMLCGTCSREIAAFLGYVEAAPIEQQLAGMKADIAALEENLNKVPNLVDGLINGIRSSVTDFIFAVSYSDNPSEPEALPDLPVANSGEHQAGKAATGQRKAPSKSAGN